jgi:hypothetical protein
MNILVNDNQSFNGIFTKSSSFVKKEGTPNMDGVFYDIKQFIYHPFKGESKSEIIDAINKNTKGLTFALWERDHGHVVYDCYKLTDIKVGDVVDAKEMSKIAEKNLLKNR